MKTHTTDPLRPAKTLCRRASSAASLDWQGAEPGCTLCARKVAGLRRMGPELVRYWAGSLSSSVQNAYDSGNFTTIHIGA